MKKPNFTSPDSNELQEIHNVILSVEGLTPETLLAIGLVIGSFYGFERALSGDS